MARSKYVKVKWGLSAYITFALLFVALVVMILLLIPSNKEKVTAKFTGSYTETNEQTQKEETKYYEIDPEHNYRTVSLNKFKKVVKNSKKYTYVLYGDMSSRDFILKAIDLYDNTEDLDINRVYILDSSKLDDDDKEEVRQYLKLVNKDIKNTSSMPTFDLWVFNNNEMINAASRSDYSTMTFQKVAQYHIFNNGNEVVENN